MKVPLFILWYGVIYRIRASGAMQMELAVEMITSNKIPKVRALLDSGCTRSSIDKKFADKHNLWSREIAKPIAVKNADGSINGYVSRYVDAELKIDDNEGNQHQEQLELQVVNLGENHDIFLGYDWFITHNPRIDWRLRMLSFDRCPNTCNIVPQNDEIQPLQEFTEEVQWWETHNEIRRVEHINATHSISTKIAAESRKTAKVEIPEQYKMFSDVFEKKEFDKLPERRPWDHAINLKEGMEHDKRLKGRVYPMNPKEKLALKEFIAENLRTGRIRPSKSPVAAPFFFVNKKDGDLRQTQDYRRINAATIKDNWPIPVIADVLNKVQNAKYFSKFDVRWGYNNVRIKEGDEWKAAFICSEGLFEPLVMFFGLTNSPATFQHMMDDIFIDLINGSLVIVYMDDILVFTDDLESHRKTVKEVLRRLRKHRLYLKLEKCQFEVDEVDFLGVIIGHGSVKMDPAKTEAIRKWPEPKNLREVRSFTGFCNFYRYFIKDYSEICVPLNELTKKDVKFEFGPRQRQAFERLKQALTEEVTLLLPVPGARFRLETDASDYATGAVLHQIVEGKPRPISFFSKTLSAEERNYQIYDKEMLAIMQALEHWKQFLRNGPEFDIWSDHQNLQYFREPQRLTRRQARWFTELAEFDYKLHHRPGKLNQIADALSRNNPPEGGVQDNENITLLDPKRFNSINRLSFRDEDELLDEIRNKRAHLDTKVIKGLQSNPKEYKESFRIVEYKHLVCVPKDRNL